MLRTCSQTVAKSCERAHDFVPKGHEVRGVHEVRGLHAKEEGVWVIFSNFDDFDPNTLCFLAVSTRIRSVFLADFLKTIRFAISEKSFSSFLGQKVRKEQF